MTSMQTSSLVTTGLHIAINIALALIPVALAYVLVWVVEAVHQTSARVALLGVLGLAWLVFLPNTCYLLTEWRHFMVVVDGNNIFLRAEADRALFLRLCEFVLFYVVYSGFGMFTLTLAIRPVARIAAKHSSHTWIWAIPFFAVVSLGVYLGLVIRFNSWDLIVDPRSVLLTIAEVGGRPNLLAFIAAFGAFLWLSYVAIDIWIDGLTERLSRTTGKRIHLTPRERETEQLCP